MARDSDTVPADSVQSFAGRVRKIRRVGTHCECVLDSGSPLLVSALLCSHIRIGDQLRISLPEQLHEAGTTAMAEVHVFPSQPGRLEIVQAPIALVTRPRTNKRGQFFDDASVVGQH